MGRTADTTLALLVLLASACSSVDDDPAVGQPDAGSDVPMGVSFAIDVVPVLEVHCVLCHRGANAQANLDLTRQRAAQDLFGPDATVSCFEGGELIERPLVVPGAPDDSALWIKVADTDFSFECGREMPAVGMPLLQSNPAAAETLRQWIADGAVLDESD
jgi:hypothetical protein